jgi:hypothetical protein
MILTMLAALITPVQDPAPAITPGTVAIAQPKPAPGTRGPSPDQPYADAVESALGDAGFTTIPGVSNARYVATVTVKQAGRGAVRSSAPRGSANTASGPVGSGVGGMVSLPVGGGGKSVIGELVSTELTVTLTRRGESAPAWQATAVTQQVWGTRSGDPAAVARKLAGALFRNFPQASGLTMSVP